MPVLSKERRRKFITKALLEAQSELLTVSKESTEILQTLLGQTFEIDAWNIVNAVRLDLEVANLKVEKAVAAIKADVMVRR